MKKKGKVLWYSQKDKNGIIIDPKGNEYYFDISVVLDRVPFLMSGVQVSFNQNKSITNCLCARNVNVDKE
ncbi:MAG TPA: hypothetical protein VI911_12205 [Patescibacteria group bacterium]|nr:hypothetical protein [Patescibacteria group bacterium]